MGTLRKTTAVCHLIGALALLIAMARTTGSDTDPPTVPAMDEDGAYVMAYKLLSKTKLAEGKPTVFDPELVKLNGKKVTITGFAQPFEDAQDMWSFMLIQYPVGCWYCEAPGPETIVLVEMPENKELDNRLTTDAVKITGILELNEKDPEDFLYIITGAAAVRAKERPPIPPPSARPVKPRPHPQ